MISTGLTTNCRFCAMSGLLIILYRVINKKPCSLPWICQIYLGSSLSIRILFIIADQAQPFFKRPLVTTTKLVYCEIINSSLYRWTESIQLNNSSSPHYQFRHQQLKVFMWKRILLLFLPSVLWMRWSSRRPGGPLWRSCMRLRGGSSPPLWVHCPTRSVTPHSSSPPPFL